MGVFFVLFFVEGAMIFSNLTNVVDNNGFRMF